jgi:pyranose oxidase
LAAQRINPGYVRYTGTDTLLGRLAEPDKHAELKLLQQHRVSRLIYRGGKVSAAVVRDLVSRNEFTIEADTFVVAAGWVHTAQILWNSWIRPPALGRYLTDHTFTACQVVLKPSLVDMIHGEASEQGHVFEPDDSVPIPMNDPTPHLYMPVRPDRLWQGLIFREAFADPISSARAFQLDPLTPTVDSRLIVDLKWFGMIDPVPDNRLTFEPDIHDRLGMPQPTFDFQLGPDDRRREAQMMQHMKDVAHELGDYLPTSLPQSVPLGASTHTMGATRMGTDPTVSVVDSHSRVWDFDNLYLGGNCVLPNPNACNPTLTSVALAIRASDDLIRRAGATPTPAPTAPTP